MLSLRVLPILKGKKVLVPYCLQSVLKKRNKLKGLLFKFMALHLRYLLICVEANDITCPILIKPSLKGQLRREITCLSLMQNNLVVK